MEEESFGQRMARIRKANGLTQRELAAELDISPRMVAYYEAQTEHPPSRLLPVLTEILGVSTDELLGVKPAKKNKPVNQRLWRRFRQIEKLPPKEKRQLLAVIDTFLDRDRLAQRGG
jgi:transcriptional regulator with XRE-family HTH domain